MDEPHNQVIGRSFAQQATTFEDVRFSRVLTTESEWLWDELPQASNDLVLDLAAGTGHGARALANDVRAVIAVDLTPEMLEVGREQAQAEGKTNIAFMQGDARALPFLPGTFDTVISRYALHHFPSPNELVAEMARCVKAGGQVGLADLLSNDDRAVAKLQNHLERLRDPSHTAALSAQELRVLIERQGLRITSFQSRVVRRPLAPWAEQTNTPPSVLDEIERALSAELDGGPPTGFNPQLETDGLTITQTLGSLVAERC